MMQSSSNVVAPSSSPAVAAPSRQYADWKAPKQDAASLIWPEPSRLLEDTHANLALLDAAEHVRVQNVPLPALRRRLRQAVGHQPDRPLVGTGHQVELYHTGVWVKNVLISRVAEKLDGHAVHLAVDTDSPKHLSLRWPGEAVSITDDASVTHAAWSGLVAAPSAAHLMEVKARLLDASTGWQFDPLMPEVIDALHAEDGVGQRGPLPEALVTAFQSLDVSLGLRAPALLASPLWGSDVFLAFVHHVMARAGEFVGDYNAALADFRTEHGMKTDQRPMPNLTASDEAVEAPFWLDDLARGSRSRPTVFRTDAGWTLSLVSGDDFTFDPAADALEAAAALRAFLGGNNHRLSPRALTLTMFVRLLLVDQFVHGIGGGRYDQITDRIIARSFGLTPPAFSVTTATLYFPDAVGRERVCVPCVLQEGHRLRHGLLGQRKREMVEEIARLPRYSRERQTLFIEMHRGLRDAEASDRTLADWRGRLDETIAREREEQTLFDRELCYALQPRERLDMLISRYHDAF